MSGDWLTLMLCAPLWAASLVFLASTVVIVADFERESWANSDRIVPRLALAAALVAEAAVWVGWWLS